MVDAEPSGYGMNASVPIEDIALTHVEFGTAMGELLRRYWHPICLSEELQDLPKFIKILGEEIVAYRDKSGEVGVLGAHCIHRGTSLEYGRIEANGIRCCYHGWYFNSRGECLDQPGEPEDSTYKYEVRQPWYPAEEYLGLVFTYMGPLETKPVLPHYDIFENEGAEYFAYRNFTRGEVAACNWLQLQENAVDPFHTYALHGYDPGLLGFTDAYSVIPSVEYAKHGNSVTYFRNSELPGDRRFIRVVEAFVPNVRSIPPPVVEGKDPEKETEGARLVGWWVPVDNAHTIGFHIEAVDPNKPLFQQPEITPQRPYEETQKTPDDKEANLSQRPIAVHALEHLATTDQGVALFRRLLKEATLSIEKGADPPATIRDPSNRIIKCQSLNAILMPGEKIQR